MAMSEEMRSDENVFLMGEDVGIFGGDFGTSVGMLEAFLRHSAMPGRQTAEPKLNHRPDVAGGLLAGESAELLRAFFASRR